MTRLAKPEKKRAKAQRTARNVRQTKMAGNPQVVESTKEGDPTLIGLARASDDPNAVQVFDGSDRLMTCTVWVL
jgi:hypothetical protein